MYGVWTLRPLEPPKQHCTETKGSQMDRALCVTFTKHMAYHKLPLIGPLGWVKSWVPPQFQALMMFNALQSMQPRRGNSAGFTFLLPAMSERATCRWLQAWPHDPGQPRTPPQLDRHPQLVRVTS